MRSDSLSTFICDVPASPRAILDEWLRRRDGRPWSLALDPRLPTSVQRELLDLGLQSGVYCPQLAHTLVGPRGRVGPSLASPSRSERRSGVQALEQTLRAAAEYRVPEVLIYPSLLSEANVYPDRSFAGYQDRISCSLPVHRKSISLRRRPLAQQALDALRASIEPMLRFAADEALSLSFPFPAPWPHQVPNTIELCQLCDEFAGAPIYGALFADWAHAARFFHKPGDVSDAERSPPRSSLRIADACGPLQGLPAGTGEVDFDALAKLGLDDIARVLVCDPRTSSEELDQAQRLLYV